MSHQITGVQCSKFAYNCLEKVTIFSLCWVSCVKVCKKLETTTWAKSPHPVTRLPVLPNVIVLYIIVTRLPVLPNVIVLYIIVTRLPVLPNVIVLYKIACLAQCDCVVHYCYKTACLAQCDCLVQDCLSCPM